MRKFEIKTNYFLKKENGKLNRIILISDVHFSSIVKDNLLNSLINKIDILKPHIVCIAGDLIDSTNEVDSKEEKDRLFKFLEKLGKICPILICLGNHDISSVKKHNHIGDYRKDLYNKYVKYPILKY